jgi:hypothetical protein
MTQHYRNEDPSTSRLAAESLDLSLKELHYMLLQHHYYHQDSDSNAGFAAFQKGLTSSPETGRRASRTLREAHHLIEFRTDPRTKSPAVVQGRLSSRLGQRNFLTEKGFSALEKYLGGKPA